MRRLSEKAIIIVFCLYNSFINNDNITFVLYFLISLMISLSIDLFTSNKIKNILYVLFIILCLYDFNFIFYLPLIAYHLLMDFSIYSFLITPLMIIEFNLFSIIIFILAIYLSYTSKNFELSEKNNKNIRDELKENTIYLRKYTEQLKIDREKNIQIAILTERNRIAREIHDSIGHVISSSILQVEALKFILDDNSQTNLDTLQNTLHIGMNDIRNSIHNLYNESFDLKSRIEMLCNEFSKLNIILNYNLDDHLSNELKFDILSIIREAVTNCIKHSNADSIDINLNSQSQFHTIIIKDNGNIINDIGLSKGIGLLSMTEITYKYNGFINYGFEYEKNSEKNNGFKIHITMMKNRGE